MDYTVSLQVQHQLAVFPTHFYQGYSVELQVHLFCRSSCFLLFFCTTLHDKRRACMQRSECDFMEMLYCGGKAWFVVLHADFFSPPPPLHRDSCCVPPRDGAERSGGCLRGAVRCGAHGGLKVSGAAWRRLTSRLVNRSCMLETGGSVSGVRPGTPQGVP